MPTLEVMSKTGSIMHTPEVMAGTGGRSDAEVDLLPECIAGIIIISKFTSPCVMYVTVYRCV